VAPRLLASMRNMKETARPLERSAGPGPRGALTIDRATAARLGVTTKMIDDTLYDAFGQRQVSTIYTTLNQYHVVMEVAPEYWQSPEALSQIMCAGVGNMVRSPRSRSSARAGRRWQVNHQGLFPASRSSSTWRPTSPWATR